MGSKRVTSMLTLAAAMILAGQPALAQGHPGAGRHHGGGGRHGGSYAVPRGGGHIGGGPQARHPRAGTGGYGYHNGGYYGHGGYGRYYGHHGYKYGYGYYPYYHGYGYYRPYGYASFYFGSPYWSVGWGWPYAWGGYNPYLYTAPQVYGYSDPPAREPERRYEDDRYSSDSGRLRLDIHPDDASVYVDDRFAGNAREARQLTLRPGPHSVEVVRPGYETARREVEVVRGETSELRMDLQPR